MKSEIKKVALLGANGTMGYGSGTLFTYGGCDVTFLARTAEKAQAGLDAGIKQVRSPAVASKVTIGSYEKDLKNAVEEADIIFEAVAENMEVKNQMFAKVDKYRKPDSIVATVSSGLSITEMAKDRSDSFRKNFVGLHFFNPPNVIVGTEIIPGQDTDPVLVDFLIEWCEKKLNRTMIKTANTPGFAGNRIGFKVLNEVAQLAETTSPAFMDSVIGPYTGRALPPLATVDLVGFDVHKAIVDNVVLNSTNDESIKTLKLPSYMQKMIDAGILGSKTGGGFYKRDGKTKLGLDIATGNYKPLSEFNLPKLDFVEKMKFLISIGQYQKAFQVFADAEGDEAKIAHKVIGGYIAYSFARAGEITEDITGIDLIMGSGFNWAPPSVLTDLIGIDKTIQLIENTGIAVPKQLASIANSGSKKPLFDKKLINIGKFFVAK